MNKYRNRMYTILAIFIAIIISSCSGGICAPESDSGVGNVLNIEMNAPSQYPASKELYVPVLVTNISNDTLSNVVYSIPAVTNTTGSTITVTNDSQANCATLKSGQTCQLTIHILPNGVVGKQNTAHNLQDATSNVNNVGSFQVLAQNNQLHAEKAVYIGLVDVPPSTGTGVDGIALLYNPTLVSSNTTNVNSSTNVLITMVVTSANVGQFNTLQIVDTNGNILTYEVLTGNSGEGMTDLTIGSIVTLAVQVPYGSTQLVFKPLLKSDNNQITNGEGQNQVIQVIPPTVKKASLNILHSLVNLNESTPTQVITVVNNGNAPASSLDITIGDHVTVINNTCMANLAAGASCNYTVSFDVSQPIVGTTTSNVSYNDTQTNQNLNVAINYRGKTPFVGLTLSSNNLTYTFNATTESPSYASIVTITNAGEVSPLTLANLPTLQYFHISTTAGTANDCKVNQVLQPGASCNILVTYDNSTVLANITEMAIGYSYIDIDSTTKTGKTSVNLNYNTVQSLAVLSYGLFAKNNISVDSLQSISLLDSNSNFTYSFGGIVNNNVEATNQYITITNIGQIPATGVNILSPDQPYNILSNGCRATIAQGDSCQVLVAFGPAAPSMSAGNKVANLFTNYLSYPSASTTASIFAKLTGNVYLANTAVLNAAVTANSGFESGNGSLAQPYQLQINNNGTVTYTLTNSGETPAEGFYVSYNPNVLLPWAITNSSCGTPQNPISLSENGGSCTITFGLNPSSVGTSSLNFANIQMNWVDQDSPNGQTQVGTGIVYVNVFAAPTITTTTVPLPIGTLLQNTNFKVVVTLAGGYKVPLQTITGTISGDTNSNMTASSSTCSVSLTNPSCSMTFIVKANPVSESGVVVNLVNSTTPQIAPTPNGYPFNVQYNTQPFYVSSASPKVGESFNFTPNFTADMPSATNPYTVTLPAGFTTDSGDSSYTMTSPPLTKHLKIAPTVAPGLYLITMTDSFGNTFTTNIPVSKLQKMMYFADGTGILSCKLNQDGSINGTCGLNNSVTNNTSVIYINSTGQYAYIGGRMSQNPSTQVKICSIITDVGSTYGNLTNCSYYNGLPNGFIDPAAYGTIASLLTNTQQTKLYIGSTSSSDLYICNITPTNPIPTSCAPFTVPGLSDIGRITSNYNGTQLILSSSNRSLSYCSLNTDGSISGCTSSPSVISGANFPIAVSFSYDNTKLFSVGFTSGGGSNPWASYTTYSEMTSTFSSSFNNGLLNNIAGRYPYLTSVAFGPDYAYIAAIGSPTGVGALKCTLSESGLLNQCNAVSTATYIGSATDGVTIFN